VDPVTDPCPCASRERSGALHFCALSDGHTGEHRSHDRITTWPSLGEERLRRRLQALAAEMEVEADDWSNDPAAMGAKADAARRIREALS
jgi:hypothetical protein